MDKALVSDIQRASVNDGYGIRTTVFFKGCPLKCAWCHTPECRSFEREELFYPEKCIGCGKCAEGCYSGARVICGKEMSARELVSELLLDKVYFEKGGGVTFSGGEPLAKAEFLHTVCDLLKDEGISAAAETSLIYFDKALFQKLDFVMADLKIWDTKLHKKYTGAQNDVIKENFIRLNELGIPIIARTPVIPGIEQGFFEISEFLKKLENVKKYELLPYHSLGTEKYRALGKEQTVFSVPAKEYMEEVNRFAYIR